MTNIKCIQDRSEYTIDIDGHAGYNPGMDIVCSAASILGYTLANALKDIEADKKIISMGEDGEIHICIIPVRVTAEEARVIVNTIMLGYTLLADQYPDNVSVEW